MNGGSLSRRYAKALLDIGIDNDSYEQICEQLNQFAALLSAHEELQSTLANPSYPTSKRKAIVEALLDRLNPLPPVRNFLMLAIDRNRVSIIESVAQEYQRLVDTHAGRVRAQITTATELTKMSVGRIREALEARTGKHVLLSTTLAPELIAGTVTQIGSVLYDGSLRTRLEQMKQSLLDGKL